MVRSCGGRRLRFLLAVFALEVACSSFETSPDGASDGGSDAAAEAATDTDGGFDGSADGASPLRTLVVLGGYEASAASDRASVHEMSPSSKRFTNYACPSA